MIRKTIGIFVALTLFSIASIPAAIAQEKKASKDPVELEVIKGSVGVWDAEIKVWSQGLDKDPIIAKGVETNKAYGKHWISSDFDSDFGGVIVKVHSIVGYDLDKKKLVGMIVDHGPYAAQMTGEYNKETKTVTWITKAKGFNGEPMTQKTTLTQKSDSKRVLLLFVPGKNKGEHKKFMEIVFTKRKKAEKKKSDNSLQEKSK